MTSQLARVYAALTGVIAFFLAWAAVAAHPWSAQPARDPRLVALQARRQQIQAESLRVKRIVEARAAHAATSAPAVRVVNLPPIVMTRTS